MNTIFRLPILLLLMCTATFAAQAQEDDMPALSGERLKEIKAQKTAYLTTKLGLTTEEAQRFWPIYNEYDDTREKLRKEMRELHKSGKEEGGLTEATAKVMLTKGLDIRTRELELERTYSERFSKSIGALKTVQLVKAERDFNKEVLRRFRDRMEERRDGRPGPPPGGRR
ncbi:MAG: hypothetical protein KA941_09130 [Flavobacteriales bacterium]|nr:hypothetical protein [Flavobacteriales bacterium]